MDGTILCYTAFRVQAGFKAISLRSTCVILTFVLTGTIWSQETDLEVSLDAFSLQYIMWFKIVPFDSIK